MSIDLKYGDHQKCLSLFVIYPCKLVVGNKTDNLPHCSVATLRLLHPCPYPIGGV